MSVRMFADSSDSSSDDSDTDKPGPTVPFTLPASKPKHKLRKKRIADQPAKLSEPSKTIVYDLSSTLASATVGNDINIDDLLAKSSSKGTDGAVEKAMKKSVLNNPVDYTFGVKIEGRRAARRRRKELSSQTKGSGWFGLPATELNEERKRDLEIIQMRDALDPKMHYKSNDSTVLPKYYQIGTVIEHPSEFYTSRIPKKQRKKTIVDELLQDHEFQQYNKRKYAEIESERARSRKGAFRKQTHGKKKRKTT